MECITVAGCTNGPIVENALSPHVISAGDRDGRGVEEEVIARDVGDMRLVVGSTRTTFVVSSHALRLASPVWRAMLSPENGFLESRSDAIPLPDDEVETLRIVLLIAHLRFRNVPPRMVELDALYNLAVLCDKYDTAELVEPFIREWLGHKSLTSRLPGTEKWLFIAWVFGLELWFIDAVDQLVANLHDRDDDIYGLGDGATIGDGRPAHVIESIKGVRRHVIADMLGICYKYVDSFAKGSRCRTANRDCHAALYTSFTQALQSLGLWPHRPAASELEYSARVLRSKLEEIQVKRGGTGHQKCDFASRFHARIERAYRSGRFKHSHRQYSFFRDTASGLGDDTSGKNFAAEFLRNLRAHTSSSSCPYYPDDSSSDWSEVEVLKEPPEIFTRKRPRASSGQLIDG